MNKLLDHAYVPLLLALALRLVFTWTAGVELSDFNYRHSWELWTFGVGFACAALCFWHRFVRQRCPNCREPDPLFQGSREVDRFVAPKKVSGTDGNGKTTTSHVSTTFVKLENHYSCSNCPHEWITLSKREHT